MGIILTYAFSSSCLSRPRRRARVSRRKDREVVDAGRRILRRVAPAYGHGSNQPNFAKGKSTLASLAEIQQRFVKELKRSDIDLLESYYCYHHPTSLVSGYSECICRKPSPEFILSAVKTHGIDLSRSWMVGDRSTDVECGFRAGLRTIRIKPDHPSVDPQSDWPKADYYCSDLLAASRIILNGE